MCKSLTYLSVFDAECFIYLPDHFLPSSADEPNEAIVLSDRVGSLRNEAAAKHRQHVEGWFRRPQGVVTPSPAWWDCVGERRLAARRRRSISSSITAFSACWMRFHAISPHRCWRRRRSTVNRFYLMRVYTEKPHTLLWMLTCMVK